MGHMRGSVCACGDVANDRGSLYEVGPTLKHEFTEGQICDSSCWINCVNE